MSALPASENRSSLGQAPGSVQAGGKAGPDKVLLYRMILLACNGSSKA